LKAGSAVLAGVQVLALSRSAHAAGTNELKVGLIGCGGRGTGALGQVLEYDKTAKVVAMGDYVAERVGNYATALKHHFGDRIDLKPEQCFSGFENYKRVIESDCDLVLIACAAAFHPLYTKTALAAGKHVFVEKPHAIDAAGIHVLEDALKIAREKNLSFLSGLHSRWCGQWHATIEKIREGMIGDVKMIQSTFLRAPYGVYPPVPHRSELDNQVANQYHFRWLCGDDVTQSLVHNLDRMNWVLGDDKLPIRCFGLGGRSSMIAPEFGDVFDHHTAVYEYPDGVRLYAMCRTTVGCYDEYDDLVIGTKGTVRWNEARIVDSKGNQIWKYDGPYHGGHLEEQIALNNAIKDGKPLISGEHLIRGTMTAILGQLACYTGKMHNYEDAYNSKFRFGPDPAECRDGMAPPVIPNEKGIYPVPIPGQTMFI